MTPEEIEKILQSNTKAIETNSAAIAETRWEVSTLYQTLSELVQHTSQLARDRSVMFEVLRGLNKDRVTLHENLYQFSKIARQMSYLFINKIIC